MRKLIIGLFVLSLSLAGAIAYAEGNDEYTVLLLHCNGDQGSQVFIDDSFAGHHTVTSQGAYIDTTQYKFGGASGRFNGINDKLTIPSSEDWNFGIGDFTIDCWVRPTVLTTQFVFGCVQQLNPDSCYYLYISNDSTVFRVVSNGSAIINVEGTSSIWNTNTWYHVAVVRSGSNFNIYRDGISIVSATDSTAIPTVGPFYVGGSYGAGVVSVNGWIDEFRVSKGIARWTSNFTPPISEYYNPNNLPPIAEAGPNQRAGANQTITLDGSASYDPDGTIVNYQWKRLPNYFGNYDIIYSGPNPTCETKALGRVEEVIQLTVTDNEGVTGTDTMQIFWNRPVQNNDSEVTVQETPADSQEQSSKSQVQEVTK